MSERLPCARIDGIAEERITYSAREVCSMATEIRDRRAADLTPENRGALTYARKVLDSNPFVGMADPIVAEHSEKCRRAMSAIDAVLRAHGVTP